jgi:hypothetical protein
MTLATEVGIVQGFLGLFGSRCDRQRDCLGRQ